MNMCIRQTRNDRRALHVDGTIRVGCIASVANPMDNALAGDKRIRRSRVIGGSVDPRIDESQGVRAARHCSANLSVS